MKKLRLDELGRLAPEEYQKIEKRPFEIVLDNVRSLHNVGSAFRTADAFLAKKIWLAGITGTPPHREIHKTALGAQETVEWEYLANISDLISNARQRGLSIIAIEQTDRSVPLNQIELPQNKPCLLIFGNEVDGVSQEVIDHCDLAVEIPQYGTKHSLNVSVTIGIVLYDLSSRFF